MWETIMARFDEGTQEQAVIEYLLDHGLSVDKETGINADGLDIEPEAVAEQVGVDKRTVEETVEEIQADTELIDVFQSLSSLPFLEEASPVLGLSVVTVQVSTAEESGLLSSIAEVFERHDIVIRQAMVEDPNAAEFPQFVAILENTVPSELIINLENLSCTTGVFYSTHNESS